MLSITKRLLKLENKKNGDFIFKLTPNIKRESVIGIKNPVLRKIAKEFLNDKELFKFLNELPHKYHDENMLHSLLISEIKDYKSVVILINKFLPYIDNWMVCDVLSPKKAFTKNKNLLIKDINKWIKSKDDYTIRFGLEMLMSFFLDEDFKKEYLIYPSKIRSKEYYVNMMIAWLFATALAKQYDSTIIYLKEKKLDKWTHNKTIQKAIESYRISYKNKIYLKTLKIK